MLYEQEYEIRYGGEGCETPPDVLRELCDLFGITGAELQRMDNLQVTLLLFVPDLGED